MTVSGLFRRVEKSNKKTVGRFQRFKSGAGLRHSRQERPKFDAVQRLGQNPARRQDRFEL